MKYRANQKGNPAKRAPAPEELPNDYQLEAEEKEAVAKGAHREGPDLLDPAEMAKVISGHAEDFEHNDRGYDPAP